MDSCGNFFYLAGQCNIPKGILFFLFVQVLGIVCWIIIGNLVRVWKSSGKKPEFFSSLILLILALSPIAICGYSNHSIDGINLVLLIAYFILAFIYGYRLYFDMNGTPAKSIITKDNEKKMLVVERRGGRWFPQLTFFIFLTIFFTALCPTPWIVYKVINLKWTLFYLLICLGVAGALIILFHFIFKKNKQITFNLFSREIEFTKGFENRGNIKFSHIKSIKLDRVSKDDDFLFQVSLIIKGDKPFIPDKGTNGKYLAKLAVKIAKITGAPFDDAQDGLDDGDII